MCAYVCDEWNLGEVGRIVQEKGEAFRRVQLNDVSWPIRYEPLTISHAVAAFPSNPAIPYPISSWFFSHICPPSPPLPCTSQHRSPYTILRVRGKKREIGRWGCWSYHPLPSNSIPSAVVPDVSYVIYDAECSNISKITMNRLENLFGRFNAFSTSQGTICYKSHVLWWGVGSAYSLQFLCSRT